MEAVHNDPAMPAEPDKRTVERSTIEFPYLDLQNAFEIAEGIHKVGGSGCDWDQLAAHFQQAAQGGGFRMRLITAKTFGLVVYDRGRITLTNLGLRAVDPLQQRAAKVDAFLVVPLYKRVYDKFRGGTLPPTVGLEREMVSMGVAKKQADKARQTFQRSAKFAGFFEFGADRLVAPSTASQPAAQTNGEVPTPAEERAVAGAKPTTLNDDLPPFILGLLQKLPEQDADWSLEARARWLTTAANIFSLMYTDKSDTGSRFIAVEVKDL